MNIEIKTKSGCYDIQWYHDSITSDELAKLMETIREKSIEELIAEMESRQRNQRNQD